MNKWGFVENAVNDTIKSIWNYLVIKRTFAYIKTNNI